MDSVLALARSLWHPFPMAEFIVGRLFGWPDFSEDGDDVWIIHIDEPVFVMRIIHRPEDTLPSGELSDLYFPLESDSRFAVGNLMFLEPRSADPRVVAELVGSAIEAVHDEEVARRLSFDSIEFNPSSMDIQLEDIPLGFVVGVMHESDTTVTDDGPWVVHAAPPPFAMRVCDLTNEDLEPEDIWGSLGDGNVLGHLLWLTSLACDRDDLLLRAETAGSYVLDVACPIMPALLPGD
jgi:hypothetical protein